MPPAIHVTDLHVRYRARGQGLGASSREVEAVRGLSFEVATGEVVGFLGPNGAGKSSTLKALMGFVEPQAGDCAILGMIAGSLEAKRRVGYLPEVAMYYPFLTPLETLRLYGELQGLRWREARHEAESLLSAAGVESSMCKLNKTLSKGQLQRVGIAQSLLGSPEVLILDEVTSGLDPIGRRELRDLLKERQKQGCTIFFSSHELSEVDSLCDRILVIDQGRLIEERDMPSLREQLRTYKLVSQTPVLFDEVEPMDTLQREDGTTEYRFADKGCLLKAIHQAARQNAAIVDLAATEESLESFFIEAVRRAA